MSYARPVTSAACGFSMESAMRTRFSVRCVPTAPAESPVYTYHRQGGHHRKAAWGGPQVLVFENSETIQSLASRTVSRCLLTLLTSGSMAHALISWGMM